MVNYTPVLDHLGPMTFTEKKMIELLVDAKILVKCHHTNANAVPLAAETDLNIFKLYFLDIGLINALMNLDLDIIDQEFKNHVATKGFLAEQFVSQHLAYIYGHQKTPELFYWLRDKDTQKGEIDFLIQVKNKIFPIEVKSNHGTHLKSLLYFSQEKESETGFKISLAKFSKGTLQFKIKDTSVKLNLINVPLFAIEHLFKTLEEP
jgi:predicted AAA+ superfamily ATPase